MNWLFIMLCSSLGFFSNENITNHGVMEVPEVALYSPEGDLLRLSDLKGEVVLVHFWASWCKPCRKRNPELVKVFKQYENADFGASKGLKVFSISLDQKKENWIEGIKHDGLEWAHHVSELKGFKSEVVKKFGITGIPSTFLLNQDGEVIGQNLFGQALADKLDELK